MKNKKIRKEILSGVIGLNSSIRLGALLTLYAILTCFWGITLLFVACPAMMIFAGVIHLQPVTAMRIFLSVLICSGGVELLPLTLKFTHHLIHVTKQYLSLNKKMFYP